MSAVTKALSLIPALIKLVAEVEAKVKAAKDSKSDGGAKVTPAEIAHIVAAEAGAFIEAIVALFVGA